VHYNSKKNTKTNVKNYIQDGSKVDHLVSCFFPDFLLLM